jgi:hypothetical protein
VSVNAKTRSPIYCKFKFNKSPVSRRKDLSLRSGFKLKCQNLSWSVTLAYISPSWILARLLAKVTLLLKFWRFRFKSDLKWKSFLLETGQIIIFIILYIIRIIIIKTTQVSAGADETLRLWKCFTPDPAKTRLLAKGRQAGGSILKASIRWGRRRRRPRTPSLSSLCIFRGAKNGFLSRDNTWVCRESETCRATADRVFSCLKVCFHETRILCCMALNSGRTNRICEIEASLCVSYDIILSRMTQH